MPARFRVNPRIFGGLIALSREYKGISFNAEDATISGIGSLQVNTTDKQANKTHLKKNIRPKLTRSESQVIVPDRNISPVQEFAKREQGS